MAEPAQYELIDHVAVVTLDDGKANAFGPVMIDTLNALLDRAEGEAKTVVLMGRSGIFSGGFDLKVIRGGDPVAARNMAEGGARLMMRLYGFPLPVVAAATGHAVALGGFCLLTADYRVGADGEFVIGLNETAIGMALPPFALMLARERLSKRYLSRAAIGATMFGPAEARDAGFLDEVVAPEAVREAALAAANNLVKLDGSAYAQVKQGLRAASIAGVLAGLDAA